MHVQFFAWSVLALAIGANGSEPEPDLRCGSYSLYIALSGMDLIHESFEAFEDRIGPPSAKGYSFGQLDAVAKSVSAHSLGVSTNLDNLRARTGQFACLALINDIHIVNVIFVTESEVTIIDAPRSYRIPNDTFLSQWDGTALLVSTSQLIPEEDLGKGRSSWAYVACGGGVVIAALFLLARRQSRVKKMRNVLAATVLVLLGCGSNDASTTIPVENVGPPRIFFEETEKNCGEVPAENKSFVVSFAFQNKGYTDLKINRIEKSCTCTTVSTNGERFPPGTSGRVNATVETGVPGSRSIALFIHTNDPLQPIIRLEAKYSAITVLRFEPDTLDFGVLRPNSEAERRVRLLRKSTGDDGDCKIEDIAGDISQRIKVAIEGATKVPDGASWEASVKITLNAGKELGTQYGYASVKISDCSMTTLMLPIQWTVKDIVDVSPTRLFLRCDENSSRSSGRIVISCDPGTRLEIRNIASSEAADEFDFEVSRLRDNVIAIGVVWNHQNSPGHRYNCISIQCSAPIDKSFDVPVSTFVRN